MVNSQMSATTFLNRETEFDKMSIYFQTRNRLLHSSGTLNQTIEDPDFDARLNMIEEQSAKVKQEIEAYWEVLKDIPIACLLIFCVQKADSTGLGNDFLYRLALNRLMAAGLLPVAKQGKHRLLRDFHSDEHISVVEDIRCVKEWGFFDREELVHRYIQLSYDFARFTFGMFLPAFDPDRLRVERKNIKYELFMDFVQLLSERDALIAKLLYFGAPSIEGVTSLKIAALDMVKLEIKFGERLVRFPKHLMQDMEAYTKPRKDSSESLVFVNVRGGAVERVHLNQAFARASLKLNKAFKFTPADLLKSV